MKGISVLGRRIAPAAIALVFGVACGGGDGPSEPVITPTSITPTLGNGHIGSPGDAVQLSVRVTDAQAQAVPGVQVVWTVTSGGGSVTPATSTTDATGTASTQWTLGAAPGDQTVTATIGSAPALTTVFTATTRAVVSCTAPQALPVGGTCLAPSTAAQNLQVAGASTVSEYVAIPYYDAGLTRARTTLAVSSTGATTASGPPNPAVSPSVPSLIRIDANALSAPVPNYAFEHRLRERERRELTPLVPGARARRADALAGRLSESPLPQGISASLAPTEPRLATVGQQLTLNANPNSACTTPINKTGIVRAVSANAAIIEDAENPAGGFTQADYDQVLSLFETLVYPVDTAAFGKQTDIDNNGQVYIFYTIEVNKLSSRTSSSFVGGFFFSRDLFPKAATGRFQACPTSNVAEIFYMLAPDPTGQFGSGGPGTGRLWTAAQVRAQTVGTIAHEFQHLINSSRRLYITNAKWPESTWMEEGLSHIAEELTFYRASGLTPRLNIDSTMLRQSQGVLDAVNAYQGANLARFRNWLRTPSTQSPFGETANDDDLETRGAIWSFLRYIADYRGSGDGDLWRQLVNNQDTSIVNLRSVFGQSVGDRFREWAAANYVDDAGLNTPGFLNHRSWNYRAVIPLLQTGTRFYELQTRTLNDASPQSFELVEGGAAYLRFGVPAGTTATVRITGPGGSPLATGVSVWLVRTK